MDTPRPQFLGLGQIDEIQKSSCYELKTSKITPGGRFANRPKTTKFLFVLTPAQREKLDKLGGSAWLREQIDNAKIKKEA